MVCSAARATAHRPLSNRQDKTTQRIIAVCIVPPCALGRLQNQRFLRAEWMSDQPHQNTPHLVNAHIHMLNHTPVQHSRQDIPATSFRLQGPSQVSGDRREGGARRASHRGAPKAPLWATSAMTCTLHLLCHRLNLLTTHRLVYRRLTKRSRHLHRPFALFLC
jgi:hypothetical protein